MITVKWIGTGEYHSIEIWEKCGEPDCIKKATHDLWQQNEYIDFRGKYCLEHILEFQELNEKE